MSAADTELDLVSALSETFDRLAVPMWMRESVAAEVGAVVLRRAAADFRENAGTAWGGERSWFTTGRHVADLAAGWLEETARDLNGDPS